VNGRRPLKRSGNRVGDSFSPALEFGYFGAYELDAKGVIHTSPGQRPGNKAPKTPADQRSASYATPSPTPVEKDPGQRSFPFRHPAIHPSHLSDASHLPRGTPCLVRIHKCSLTLPARIDSFDEQKRKDLN
jgi:hypothetical protein